MFIRSDEEERSMLISTKGRYALRVMADLARNGGEEYVVLMDIAERQNISEKYLEGIVAALREQNLPVRCFLYELATQRFSDVMWAMQQILFKSLDRRLATFLLAEAGRTGSSTIRMTHEQIAQHISSAREAVARMLKSFSEDGLVALKRGEIVLRDVDGLMKLQ